MIQAKIALLPKIYISRSRKTGKRSGFNGSGYDSIHINTYSYYKPIKRNNSREGA